MLLQQLKMIFLSMINNKDKQKSWHKQPASIPSHSSKLGAVDLSRLNFVRDKIVLIAASSL